MKPTYRYGVEEEFFIVDQGTGDGVAQMPADVWADLGSKVPSLTKELLQSQVEIQTDPCLSSEALMEQLVERRGALIDAMAHHGLAVVAAGTHPTMDWRDAVRSKGARYAKLVRMMRMLAQRNMFCGLHVHVETSADVSRIDLINRAVPFLPLFLALSVSSPFWSGLWTGMCGYRLTGYDELPRTGLPPVLTGEADYQRFVGALTQSGAIEDASFIWWGIRPSAKYPTLELRICDSVTDVREAAAIAGLFRCLVRRLTEDPLYGPRPSPLLRAITDENRWQVQCDGAHATLIEPWTLTPVAAADLIRRVCADLESDAHALGSVNALNVIDATLRDGTSADHQIGLMQQILESGKTMEDALGGVKSWMMAQTRALG